MQSSLLIGVVVVFSGAKKNLSRENTKLQDVQAEP